MGQGQGKGRRWRPHRHSHRDFWRAWREEQRKLGEEETGEAWEPGCPISPGMMHAWREFFHSFMDAWPERHWAFGGRRFRPWHQGMASFNPFVASLLSKGGGLLPLYVLHLLAESPRYGNEVMALLAERTGGMWVANPGAIYPLMTLLETEGLIEGQWEDPQKRTVRIYNLTEAGEGELDRLKTIVRPKLREAIEVLEQIASDLNGKESEGSEEQPSE